MVIAQIEGIGETYGAKLEAIDVRTPEALLELGATRKGRRTLAERTGIREELILTWVNHADLMRIAGVGPQFAELLEAAGVDSPAELARRRADHLADALHDADAEKHLVGRVPSAATVQEWIEQARQLSRVVEH
jgi:predicted flap endonuclease-1-like 5' DNA nuclease